MTWEKLPGPSGPQFSNLECRGLDYAEETLARMLSELI